MTETRNFDMTVTLPSEREIRLQRAFNAPRALVFEAATKPEHVSQWWGPRGTSLSLCEIDLRVGGKWRFVIAGPNGDDVDFYGVYREIDAPERIVHTEIFAPYPDTEAIVTVTFDEEEGVTTITSTSLYPTEEIRDMVVASGMEGGARETYERLAELLERMKEAA